MSKIGIGLVTYNREERCKPIFEAIEKFMPKDSFFVVINDGALYEMGPKINKRELANYVGKTGPVGGNVRWHCNFEQMGVAYSKNRALRILLQEECEHIFLIEDDIEILDGGVFEAYIKASETTKLRHFNFQHSNNGGKTHRARYQYPEGVVIDLFRNPEAGFSYFHRSLLNEFGLFDPVYMNAFEHIDYEYRLAIAEVAPPFWWFPDISNSTDFLKEVVAPIDNSTITDKPNYRENWQKSAAHFVEKHGRFTNTIFDPSPTIVEAALKKIARP